MPTTNNNKLREITKIKNRILKSKDNDRIFEDLDLLIQFMYKVPDQTLAIVNIVLEKKKSNEPKIYKIGDSGYKYKGKTHKDLVLKCIELLREIRYLRSKEVFKHLIILYYGSDDEIKNEAKDTLEKLLEYNIMVLKKVGTDIQREILDIILDWSNREKVKNIEIIELAAGGFLKTTVEGISMADYKTMAFQQGALTKSEHIEKIREDIINLLFELYNYSKNLGMKLRVLKILPQASHLPGIGQDNKNLFSVVVGNIKTLVTHYEKLIFEKDKLVVELSIVQEVEGQLVWFNKNHKENVPEITDLLEEIRNDKFYNIFKTLVGDSPDLDETSWEEARQKNEAEMDKIFKDINEENIKEWDNKLNMIAEHKGVIEDWKFKNYRELLLRMSEKKPKLAEILLRDVFKRSIRKPIKEFIDSFLFGFRKANNTKFWDKYTAKILASRNVRMIAGIFGSFWVIEQKNVNNLVKEKDIKLFEEAVKKRKRFKFLTLLSGKDKNELFGLHNVLIQSLLHIYASNPGKMESLVVEEIQNNPSPEYLNMYIRQLGMAGYRKSINISKWQAKNISFILDKLIDSEKLDYDAQFLMLAIGEKHFAKIMNVLKCRIERGEETRDKKSKEFYEPSHYEPIPYHFDEKFKAFLITHPEYLKTISGWIEGMDLTKQISNWDLGHLIYRVGGPTEKILSKIAERGGRENLLKVVGSFELMSSPDFGLCFKIVEKTDEKDEKEIWPKVKEVMYRMGVVSGEYGIVDAYKNKLSEVERYEEKYQGNENVLRFIRQIKSDLRSSIVREKQRADKEIQLRKLEFKKGV